MALQSSETALLLIDIQRGFDDPLHWGTVRSTPAFERNVAWLLDEFRSSGAHVLHVCHHSIFETSPLHPSKETSDFMPCAAPIAGEPVFPKTTNSPFIETNLESEIRSRGIKRLVICGLMTAHCVSTTVRMASNLGVVEHFYGTPFSKNGREGRMVVVDDATATFNVRYGGKEYDAEAVHAIHLSSLKDEFCDVESSRQVVATLRAAHGPDLVRAKL